MKLIILIIFIGVVFVSPAFAAPAVTSATGTFIHGQPVTIGGSGYGSKSPAAPYLYDNVQDSYTGLSDGDTIPVGVGYTWGTVEGSEGYPPTYNTSNLRGVSTANYTNKHTLSSNMGIAVVGSRTVTSCGTLYLSFWLRPDSDLTNTSDSRKLFRLGDDVIGADSITYILQVSGQYDVYDSSEGYLLNNYNAGEWTVDEWSRLETTVNNTGATLPVTLSKNGVVVGSGSAATTKDICTVMDMGAAWSNGNNPHPRLDFGEIYVDNTLARVEICSGSTWAAKSHCEIQIPSAWAAGEVTFMVNRGSFGATDTAYLYVVDPAGAANSSGYSVTFSGGGGDGTAPVPVISTADPSTISSDALTVTGTSSDAVGVTSCKYRIGSAPNAGNGTACTGTTSWSCSTSGYASGANTLYVGCADAAGNWGSDSIVVNYTLDITNPSVTINNPTIDAAFDNNALTTIFISGVSSDNIGVTSITWVNDRGGSGTATGTTSWSITGISISSGSNVLTVTAHDAAGNTSTDVLTVTRTAASESAGTMIGCNFIGVSL